MVKNILCLLVISTITACSFNNEYINREEDNTEGKVFLKHFYSIVENKKYNNLNGLISDSLKIIANGDGVNKLLKNINARVGNYKEFFIQDYYIKSISGRVNETSYNYKLKVIYDNGAVDEIVGLKKEAGATIKINSYHAYSKLLIQ